jgi:hypothetical protein
MFRLFEVIQIGASADKEKTAFEDLETDAKLAYLRAYASSARSFLGSDWTEPCLEKEEVLQAVGRLKKPPLARARRQLDLVQWRFRPDPGDRGEREQWFADAQVATEWQTVRVPHVERTSEVSWFACELPVPEEGREVWLDFECVLDGLKVWLDGAFVADHNGFEPFRLALGAPRSALGPSLLVLRAQGRFQSGIAGKVRYVQTHTLSVHDVFVWTRSAGQDAGAEVVLDASVANDAPLAWEGSLEVSVTPWHPEPGGPGIRTTRAVRLEPHSRQPVTLELQIPEPRLWSPQHPNLYLAHVVLQDTSGNAVDDAMVTAGLRTIQANGNRISLNGKPVLMRGFLEMLIDRESLDGRGLVAPSDEDVVQAFLLAKRANANYLRLHPIGDYRDGSGTHHYVDQTNYERIAEIADQLGIMLTWPTRCWYYGQEGLDELLEIGCDNIERLVLPSIRRVRNHPSVVMYEGSNEMSFKITEKMDPPDPDREKARRSKAGAFQEFLRAYPEKVESVDPTRLVNPDSEWWQWDGEDHVIQGTSDALRRDSVVWSSHTYSGWFCSWDRIWMHVSSWPGATHPVVLLEFGAEAMPVWNLHEGASWCEMWDSTKTGYEQQRIGRALETAEWEISQAYQAFVLQRIARIARFGGAAGLSACCLRDGLARGKYHKGCCDIANRPKMGFHCLAMSYQDVIVGTDGKRTVFLPGEPVNAQLLSNRPDFEVRIRILDSKGAEVHSETQKVSAEPNVAIDLEPVLLPALDDGYYAVKYELAESEEKRC